MDLPRRRFLGLAVFIPVVGAAADGSVSIRGKLTMGSGNKPALRTSDGRLFMLSGDEDTSGVLADKRLTDTDFEAIGRKSGDVFVIDPIHTTALYVHKDSKRLRVTYWCDVCAIRTYTPGLCWCCREETQLDLRAPDTVVSK